MNNATILNASTIRHYDLPFVVYNICVPLYFIFVLSGHLLLLFAFLKQLKSEPTYMYQVYYAGSETLTVLAKTLFFFGTQTMRANNGVYWNSVQESWAKCYTCVWYSARLATPLASGFSTLSLFLSTVMAADRVFALLKPMTHRDMNHKVWQKIVLAVCVVVSLSASAFDINRNRMLARADGSYAMEMDTAYMATAVVKALVMVRAALQISGLIALSVFSLLLCYLYRTRFVNTKSNWMSKDDMKVVKTRERALVFLTLLQCAFTVGIMSINVANFCFQIAAPVVYAKVTDTLLPSVDVLRMIVDVSNFYIVLALSKKFRRMVIRALCCRKGNVSVASVTPMK